MKCIRIAATYIISQAWSLGNPRPNVHVSRLERHGHRIAVSHPAVAHHPPVSGPHTLPPYQPPLPFSRPPEPPLSSAHHHHHHDDRRLHHDHEPYAPSQDHTRQLPPSPAHQQHFSPYGPRDPSVKRDPGEETALPQLRRPPSTGNGIDNLPPPLPHGHHPSHQHPDEPRLPMSFDSGPPMLHSPVVFRPSHNNYHPPTPVAQHHQYDSPRMYGPLTPHDMYPKLEIQAAASAKRKAQRASQACDSCKQLKAKCDETKPCKNCREKNVEYKYWDPPAKPPDKVTTDILELLTSLRKEVSRSFATMRKMESSLASMETSHRQLNQGAPYMEAESIEEDNPPDYCQSPEPNNRATAEQALSSPGGTVVEPDLTLNQARETLRQINDNDLEAQPGRAVTPGKPVIPQNHTTLAGLLLKWPAIRSMVQHLLEAERIEHVEEFPIRQEQPKGQLRIFGRGEGFDQDSGVYDKVTPPENTMADIGDDISNPSSPAPNSTGQAWGQVGGLTPPPSVDYRGSVLNVEGNPDWKPSKVWKYVQSFKDNILNMHPIFIYKELDAMVRVFLCDIPKSTDVRPAKVGSMARFLTQPTIPPSSFPEPVAKRKRSPGGEEQYLVASFHKPGRPFQTIHNALILLVLALGKICLHKDRIPDPVYDSDPIAHNSFSVRNRVTSSPPQGSPPMLMSQSHSSGLPSPRDNERIYPSRRTSLQGAVPVARGPQSYKRNIDVIPGLEYFALATEIIGSQVGGATLKHVHVHLLAGLYHGQLGRVMDSWAFITLISQKSLVRLSAKDPGLGHSRKDNQLAFAFWTCLQLESDILAELSLPQSGILQFEERMPYPDISLAIEQGFSSHVVESYLAQLYLRKQLNKAHRLLYDREKDDEIGRMIGSLAMEDDINSIQSALKDARHTWVPFHYSWNDEDPPATDILSARLRAKYWGSQVILYRPLLKNMLNREPLPPSTCRIQSPPPDAWASLGFEIGSLNLPSNVDPRTINYARLAIQALVESTRAFHGMDRTQRIIVTNVFGTAHAQWGNLLTLAACYRDSILTRFIDKETLRTLFLRTIAFFQTIVQSKSALAADMNILIGLARDLGFIKNEYDARGNSSP
ncbi:Uu.00g024420.m01.CDS01 [Anthostomella pinea]|uniref:Uu.00g024420.m01.CDS01 n=1 Tax=Anthostomella pinea TaxID=933095 RepID=A0AAI8W1G5_9PEZI|nr:Uu.00g024420.m01.CDS01 [Anthostomella pinea]